jgi:hypothetical protein
MVIISPSRANDLTFNVRDSSPKIVYTSQLRILLGDIISIYNVMMYDNDVILKKESQMAAARLLFNTAAAHV